MTTELLPCPFCGSPPNSQTLINENGKVWGGMKWSEPSSVSVQHWCSPVPGQPSRMVERVGRDHASAIAAWNRRTPTTPTEGPALLTDEQIEELWSAWICGPSDAISTFARAVESKVRASTLTDPEGAS